MTSSETRSLSLLFFIVGLVVIVVSPALLCAYEQENATVNDSVKEAADYYNGNSGNTSSDPTSRPNNNTPAPATGGDPVPTTGTGGGDGFPSGGGLGDDDGGSDNDRGDSGDSGSGGGDGDSGGGGGDISEAERVLTEVANVNKPAPFNPSLGVGGALGVGQETHSPAAPADVRIMYEEKLRTVAQADALSKELAGNNAGLAEAEAWSAAQTTAAEAAATHEALFEERHAAAAQDVARAFSEIAPTDDLESGARVITLPSGETIVRDPHNRYQTSVKMYKSGWFGQQDLENIIAEYGVQPGETVRITDLHSHPVKAGAAQLPGEIDPETETASFGPSGAGFANPNGDIARGSDTGSSYDIDLVRENTGVTIEFNNGVADAEGLWSWSQNELDPSNPVHAAYIKSQDLLIDTGSATPEAIAEAQAERDGYYDIIDAAANRSLALQKEWAIRSQDTPIEELKASQLYTDLVQSYKDLGVDVSYTPTTEQTYTDPMILSETETETANTPTSGFSRGVQAVADRLKSMAEKVTDWSWF